MNTLPLIEDLNWWYGLASRKAYAATQRWKHGKDRYVDINLNAILKEWDMSHENRHVIVHEWSHVFCKHRGDYFVMWRDRAGPDPFSRFLDNHQERQAEYVSAYVLIKLSALIVLKDATDEEVARILDVPHYLVSLRWYIWRKYSR